MPEHRIRLRGPWDCSAAGEAGPGRRVDLPLADAGALPTRSRLARKFGRPPYDPALDSLRLELADVPGLLGVRLNGVDCRPADPGGPRWSIPIDDPLPSRNELTLDVDLSGLGDLAAPWGSIALVIGPKGRGP